MEDADLYDDIFESAGNSKEDESGNLDDLYEIIHIPQVAETAISKAKVLEEDNMKLKSQTAQLKKQISILSNINSELKTANTNLQKNLNSLVETSRIEINRKKNEISEIRKELDSVLRNRAAKNLSRREIEDVLERARPKEDPYFESRLPVKPPSSLAPTKMQSGIRVLVAEAKDTKTVVNCKTPIAATLANRQFVKKKRPPQLEKAGKSIESVGSADQNNDISMISKYFGGRKASKTTKKQTGSVVEEKAVESNSVIEVPKKSNHPVVNDRKGSIKPVCAIINQDTSSPLPTTTSEINFKHKEIISDESREEPSNYKTTEISKSLSTSDTVCDDRLAQTTDHLEKSDHTSKVVSSPKDAVKQPIPAEPMAKDKTTMEDVEEEGEELELEQKHVTVNEDEVEGRTFLPEDLPTKTGQAKDAQINEQGVNRTGPEDVISFAINSEDELDFEAEEDTEEEAEPSKIEDKKPFVIPKVDKEKNMSSQPNDLQKRENVMLPVKIADPKTISASKYRNHKDDKRFTKSGDPTSRSRSPHRNRKRSRSRNRVEKTEIGCRGRGEVKSRRGSRKEERSSEARLRKERDRERSPKKETWSREKGDRKGHKGSKYDQRNEQVEPDRNRRSLRTQEPKSKKRKSESKLEELDDNDLLRLRKELLKQMKEEDLEKLEAANDNVEDGEIADSDDDDEENNDSKEPKKDSFDLRTKLKRKSSDPKESSANKNKDTGSDKENLTQKETKSKGAQRPLLKRTSQDEKEVLQDKAATGKGSKHGVERNQTNDQEVKREGRERKAKDEDTKEEEDGEEGMRPELLLGFTTEDIDHKLIPFKKRQFKQLQFEEIQLKVNLMKHLCCSFPRSVDIAVLI